LLRAWGQPWFSLPIPGVASLILCARRLCCQSATAGTYPFGRPRTRFADDVVLNLAPDEVFGSHRGEAGLLSTSRKSTAGVSLPAFEWYFLETCSIGLLTEYRCYQLGIEILRELMHFAVGDTEDLTVVIVI
jgi:hypothetical protein